MGQQEFQNHEMIADLLESWEDIDSQSELISLGYRVHFEPKKFAADNPDPNIDEFKLKEDELLDLGL